MLAKHAKELKGQNFDPEDDIVDWMKRLEKYAFDFFSNNPQKDTRPYFDAHLSILFRNTEKKQYEFIHKSFYEFFLAKHLAKMENDE